MKRINSSYKLIEFLSGRGSGTDTIVNVATVELRFRAVVLIKKFVFNVAYEKIGVLGVVMMRFVAVAGKSYYKFVNGALDNLRKF